MEHIIEMARMLRKPFCVVPCCVYPADFPWRQVVEPDGSRVQVRQYEQLLRYIQQKCPQTVLETLPFEGRNKVLYCTHWPDEPTL